MDHLLAIHPKEPKNKKHWIYRGKAPGPASQGAEAYLWQHPQGFSVISSLDVVESVEETDAGPQWHVSVSKNGGRCTSNEAQWVCKQFDISDGLEDNHVPGGFVRNFWLPVGEKYIGEECPCVDSEPAFKENNGDFIWRGINS